MNRFWPLFLLFFSLISCGYFTSREEQTQQLVNDELLTIDWNEVDAYPLFENCDELATKADQRSCFENTMLQHFSAAFSDFEYLAQGDLNQQLYIDFLIDEHGFISIQEIEQNETVTESVPGIYNEINNRLNDLTTVKPAHKRGIPVKMKFRLPLVVNTN